MFLNMSIFHSSLQLRQCQISIMSYPFPFISSYLIDFLGLEKTIDFFSDFIKSIGCPQVGHFLFSSMFFLPQTTTSQHHLKLKSFCPMKKTNGSKGRKGIINSFPKGLTPLINIIVLLVNKDNLFLSFVRRIKKEDSNDQLRVVHFHTFHFPPLLTSI